MSKEKDNWLDCLNMLIAKAIKINKKLQLEILLLMMRKIKATQQVVKTTSNTLKLEMKQAMMILKLIKSENENKSI